MINLREQKILVTGAHGFLGGHVLKKLRERGVSEENIVSPSREEVDLRIKKNCQELTKGVGIVFHIAGVTGDAEFHKNNPGEIFYNNIAMGMELLEASRLSGVKKFISIGSATEYPESVPLPMKEENLWIGKPAELHIGYTIAKKVIGVQAAAYQRQYGMSAIHLLLTNMYGPGKEAGGGFVITNIIKRILKAKKENLKSIEVWGTGRATRDFIYVTDAAEGIVRAGEMYEKEAPVNIGSGWEISIRELVTLIAEIMEFQGEIIWDTTKPDGVMRRMLDPGRAEKEFSFQPIVSFEEGLRETIRWHETNS